MTTQTLLEIQTEGRGLVEITTKVRTFVRQSAVAAGLCVVFCQHTSASLLLHENADPTARADLERWLEEVAPESARYAHAAEGPDDMPAHLRAVLTGSSLTIPIVNGDVALGTWQGIFLCEHRARGHRRWIVIHLQ